MSAMGSLTDFIEDVVGDSHLRVESDLGDGFVRLRSSEAERRQAAQDIRSSEDVLIELLRNARDAGSKNIYVGVHREGTIRTIVVIDDGEGIPATMHEHVFEPRVTSKLDTAHMDKWGMHGRGMALYSIAVNATEARVAASGPGLGTVMCVTTDLTKLPEKVDQSTFPDFEVKEGGFAMRGPKNLVRIAAEFALEHRHDCEVYFGSFTEIAATLYHRGVAQLSLPERVFRTNATISPYWQRLAFCEDPALFAKTADELQLSLSERSARRILDGSTAPVDALMDLLKAVLAEGARNEKDDADRSEKGAAHAVASKASTARARGSSALSDRDRRGLKMDADDIELLRQRACEAYREIAERYFLEGDVKPEIRVSSDAIRITIPVEKLR